MTNVIEINTVDFKAFAYVDTNKGMFCVDNDGTVYELTEERQWSPCSKDSKITSNDYNAIRYVGLNRIYSEPDLNTKKEG